MQSRQNQSGLAQQAVLWCFNNSHHVLQRLLITATNGRKKPEALYAYMHKFYPLQVPGTCTCTWYQVLVVQYYSTCTRYRHVRTYRRYKYLRRSGPRLHRTRYYTHTWYQVPCVNVRLRNVRFCPQPYNGNAPYSI